MLKRGPLKLTVETITPNAPVIGFPAAATLRQFLHFHQAMRNKIYLTISPFLLHQNGLLT